MTFQTEAAALPTPMVQTVSAALRTVRVLTTGSREHQDTQLIEDALLDSWHDAVQIYGHGVRIAFVEGACPDGADLIVHRWALAHEAYGVVSERLEADWDHCAPNCPPAPGHRRRKKPGDTAHPGKLDDFCPGAGPRRNAELVRRGAYLCLGFPLGRSYGTRNCMKLARAASIPVREVTR
ncbi:SLOG family protein [Streptomyces lydicus]|uniref:SLOG family protein n=1 Tax=Streptomyces lydicus TaxID=47763 RepID=UPI0037A95FD0